MKVRDHPTGLSGAYGASPLISGRLRGSRVEISKEKSNAFLFWSSRGIQKLNQQMRTLEISA